MLHEDDMREEAEDIAYQTGVEVGILHATMVRNESPIIHHTHGGPFIASAILEMCMMYGYEFSLRTKKCGGDEYTLTKVFTDKDFFTN